MPFHAVFLGFSPAPPRTPVAQLAAIDHQHAQLAGTPLGHAFHGRLLIPALRLRFSAHTHPLHQGVERRVINGLRPAAGHLRRLLIRTGGRCSEAEFLSKPRRQFLMRPQLPRRPERTAPLTGIGILAVINDELYLAQFASQRQGSSPTLPEGEKPRRFARPVLADVPPVGGGPIRGFRPQLHVRCPPGMGMPWILVCSVSCDDTADMVDVSPGRGTVTLQILQNLRTVSRCTRRHLSPGRAGRFSLSPGERAGVRASVKPIIASIICLDAHGPPL